MTELDGCSVTFEPGEPPRAAELVVHHGPQRPPRRLPIGEALPVLLRTVPAETAEASVRLWREVAVAALRGVADGSVVPQRGPDGVVVHWRAGQIPPGYQQRLVARAARLFSPGEATRRVRQFADAVADTLTDLPSGPAGSPTEAPASVSLRLIPTGEDLSTAGWRVVVQVSFAGDPARPVDAGRVWRDGGPPGARGEVLLALRRAADRWPPLAHLLDQPVPDELTLDPEEIDQLLSSASRQLAEMGVPVQWPAQITGELTAAVSFGDDPAAHPGGPAGAIVDQPVCARWRPLLDGEPLTDGEQARLATAAGPVVWLRNRWVLRDPAIAARVAEPSQPAALTATEAVAAALTGQLEIDGRPVPVHTTGALTRLRDLLTADPVSDPPLGPPPGLAADLRGYQQQGLRWLTRLTSRGLGACLADDMGLGKTITLIALHLHRHATGGAGPTLVVCPASLLGNWQQEIIRFAPGVPVRRFHGQGRTLKPAPGGFLLTTYATMRNEVDQLAAHRWGLLVADEAQQVKNPGSATSQALRRLPADARVALTGTPVENNLSELWAILEGSLPAFRARFAAAVEGGADPRQRRDAAPGPGAADADPPETDLQPSRPVPARDRRGGAGGPVRQAGGLR